MTKGRKNEICPFTLSDDVCNEFMYYPQHGSRCVSVNVSEADNYLRSISLDEMCNTAHFRDMISQEYYGNHGNKNHIDKVNYNGLSRLNSAISNRLQYLFIQATFSTKSELLDYVLYTIPETVASGKYGIVNCNDINKLYLERYNTFKNNIDFIFSRLVDDSVYMIVEAIPMIADIRHDEDIIAQNCLMESIVQISNYVFTQLSILLSDTYPIMFDPMCHIISDLLRVLAMNMMNATKQFFNELDDSGNMHRNQWVTVTGFVNNTDPALIEISYANENHKKYGRSIGNSKNTR